MFDNDEGKRYQLPDRRQIVGAKNYGDNPDELIRLCSAKPNEPYNGHEIDKDVEKIKNYIGWQGKQPTVTPQVIWGEQPGTCRVVYQVEERPPATVGLVIVDGNDQTHENRIRAKRR